MADYKKAFPLKYRTMPEHARELNEFLKDCREDMHEPDEQGISAEVFGSRLDNACGADLRPDALVAGHHELVVIIRNEEKGEYHSVNLATLLALARKARFDE